MARKKILHLITGLEIGGAEMMLLKTLPRLQDDFDNRVCCIRGHGPIAEKLENAGVPVVFLNLNGISNTIAAIFRFRKIILDFRPDILVTYLIHADLFGRIFGRLFGIRKIICNQRGKLLQWEFLRILDRATKSLVTKYIVQTETAKRELMRTLRLPEAKFTVIPNTINVQEFEFKLNKDEKRKNLGLSASDIVVTCVSKLRRGKGHEYLLEAFESLACHSSPLLCHSRGDGNPVSFCHPELISGSSPRKSLKLLVVGDGEQKQELLNQVENYASKSSILFLGNRDDVKEILKISDIFVLATEGEGMSNAIMEAMASGLPVITTDIPENRELIENDRTGILVSPKDSDAIAQPIEVLFSNKPERKRLGENAYKYITENFMLPVITKKMSDFYRTL